MAKGQKLTHHTKHSAKKMPPKKEPIKEKKNEDHATFTSWTKNMPHNSHNTHYVIIGAKDTLLPPLGNISIRRRGKA